MHKVLKIWTCITNTLLQQSNITCDASGRLIVKGFQIGIFEINLEDLVCSHWFSSSWDCIPSCRYNLYFHRNEHVHSSIQMWREWKKEGCAQWTVGSTCNWRLFELVVWSLMTTQIVKLGLPGDIRGSFFGRFFKTPTLGCSFWTAKAYTLRQMLVGGPGGAKGARGVNGRDISEKLKLGISSRSNKLK